MKSPQARFRAEARATCTTLEEVAKALLRAAHRQAAEEAPAVSADTLRHLAHRLGFQGGRLDQAERMARPTKRRSRK